MPIEKELTIQVMGILLPIHILQDNNTTYTPASQGESVVLKS